MLLRRSVSGILLTVILTIAAHGALGQNYPNRSIRIITSPPGGSADFVVRLIAPGISRPLGQTVIVENRPNTLIPEAVAKALPDGYTLALVGQSFWIAPFLEKTAYHPPADFSPITLTNTA